MRYEKLFAFCLLQACAVATQPPDPNDASHETLGDYRRRLNISFGYHTKHINPELCRTLSEEECQRLDDTSGEQIRRNQQLLKPEQHRKLQATTLNVLVLLVVWPEHASINRPLISTQDLEVLFNAQNIDGVINRSGSVSRFFQRNSYGQVDMRATIIDWTEADNSEAFYSNPNMGRTEALAPAFRNALEQAESQGVDFSQFDQDNDGFLDLTVVLHTGFDGIEAGNDCDTGAAPAQRIASHALPGPPSTSDWIGQGIYRLGGYSVASVYRQVCDLQIARLNIITHEMFHPLGLPDLYDIEGPLNPEFGRVGGIGGYDIMANPNGQMDRPAFPGYLSAWSKLALGWVNPIDITSDGTYEARATENFPDIYRITPAGCAAGEYFLIENRQPIPEDFDERFWTPGGITIYHIDENNMQVNGFGNSPRGGTFLPGWPINNGQLHYPVALLQRDGAYELEQSLNEGHIEDVYTSSNHALPPGSGGTFPNTDCYAFGNIISTGITINNFQAVAGSNPTTMRFDVIGLQAGDPTDSPTSPPTAASTGLPTMPPTEAASESPSFGGTTFVPSFVAPSVSTNPTITPFPSDMGSESLAPSSPPSAVVSTMIPATMNPIEFAPTPGIFPPILNQLNRPSLARDVHAPQGGNVPTTDDADSFNLLGFELQSPQQHRPTIKAKMSGFGRHRGRGKGKGKGGKGKGYAVKKNKWARKQHYRGRGKGGKGKGGKGRALLTTD